MRLDIIYDTVCPWCYIGKRRLEQALRLRPMIPVEARWRPFLLNPDTPPEGIDRTRYLVDKFGTGERVRQVYGAISEAGKSAEIDFAFDRIDRTPNSVNSHRVVRFAERHGKAEDAVEALFLSYFVNGGNIGDIDVLVGIGADLGLDASELRPYLGGPGDVDGIYAENARAHRLGVNGVPSFFFEGGYVISGAQVPEVLARVLDAAAGETA